MNFWNDPSQNASKSVLLIAILALVGVGIYKFAGTPDNSQTGKVIQGTKYNITNTGDPQAPTCNPVTLGNSTGSSCSRNDASCNSFETGSTEFCTGPSGNRISGCCTTSGCFSGNGSACDPKMESPVGTPIDADATTNLSGGTKGGTKVETGTGTAGQ